MSLTSEGSAREKEKRGPGPEDLSTQMGENLSLDIKRFSLIQVIQIRSLQ